MFYNQDYFIYTLIAGVLSFIGMFVSGKLQSKFKYYSRIPISAGMSGMEIAQEMLSFYGINDVNILMGKGTLTDHYNPANKTVNLSPPIYQGRSVMAAAVAAHECGHAVQHAKGYPMLNFRSAIVPVVRIASMLQQYVLIAAFMVFNTFPNLMLIAIGTFIVTTLFAFVTLPVEFDASKRALAWLKDSGRTQGAEYDGAKDALWWAAMTYVSAALTALISLLYLILRYTSSDR